MARDNYEVHPEKPRGFLPSLLWHGEGVPDNAEGYDGNLYSRTGNTSLYVKINGIWLPYVFAPAPTPTPTPGCVEPTCGLNRFKLVGYTEGTLTNSGMASGNTAWDGVFRYYAPGELNTRWSGWAYGSDERSIGGYAMCEIGVDWSCNQSTGEVTWHLFLMNLFGDSVWRGRKHTGDTPAGTYTRYDGMNATPTTFDVALESGTTQLASDGITCNTG